MSERAADVFVEHPAIGMLGWVLFTLIFFLSGITHFTDRYPRLGAWLIAVFLVPVTATVHGYLMLHAPDDASRQIQLSFFLKGVTMTGAALLITQFGVRKAAPRDTARP
jgi:hypothetical protein